MKCKWYKDYDCPYISNQLDWERKGSRAVDICEDCRITEKPEMRKGSVLEPKEINPLYRYQHLSDEELEVSFDIKRKTIHHTEAIIEQYEKCIEDMRELVKVLEWDLESLDLEHKRRMQDWCVTLLDKIHGREPARKERRITFFKKAVL